MVEDAKTRPAEEVNIRGGIFARLTALFICGECAWTNGSVWGCSGGSTGPKQKDIAFDLGGWASLSYTLVF